MAAKSIPKKPAPALRVLPVMLLALMGMVAPMGGVPEAEVTKPQSRRAERASRRQTGKELMENDDAALDIGAAVVGIIVVVLAVVIGAQVLSSMAPTYFAAITDLVASFTNATIGVTVVDDLMPTFALVVGILAVVGFLSLVIGIVAGRGNFGGSGGF